MLASSIRFWIFAKRICSMSAMALLLLNSTLNHAQQTCPAGLALIQPTTDYDQTQNGGATVTHLKTGLTWMRCSVGQTWNGSTCQGTATTLNWAAALLNAKNETNFGGGWRLPNISELRSIIETGCDIPAINITVFPATPVDRYWSSTTYAGSPASAWYAGFALGGGDVDLKSSAQLTRLVRDGFSFGGFDAFGMPPNAPVIGMATAGNAQVSVAFSPPTPPANSGSNAISSYTATCNAQSNTGASSPIVVLGLSNKIATTCTVTATNDNGQSTASAPSNSVTPFASYAVTPSTTSANGIISPNTVQTVVSGATAMFTVTPNTGYSAVVSGTCGGMLAGNTYTTNAITAPCTVEASFTLNSYTVTPSAGVNGTINPSVAQSVSYGTSTNFAVMPNIGYSATVGGTCGGSLVGNVYTTSAITAPCTVEASFTLNTYTVTPSAGLNGTLTPATPQTINYGANTTFTVAPDAGYTATVVGTCGGALVGNTYTTNAITANCSVDASFAVALALVSVQSRKLHGTAGSFDILIDATQAIGAAVSVEPRGIGAGHQIVFQFNQPITSVGGATASPVGTAAMSFSGSEVTVSLTNVPDNRRVTVSLTSVNGTPQTPSASIGFLVGDVNGTRTVNASDISAVKARSGQAASATNFKFDLNATGAINASDISAVKARSGLTLTP